MSFRDLESGHRKQSIYEINKEEAKQELSWALAAGLFQLQTAVASFCRLVNLLGTPKDTLQLRHNMHNTRTHIQQLNKDIHAKIRQACHSDHHSRVIKKIADAKLIKNFEAVLKEFQKAQQLSAQMETSYTPSVHKQSSYSPLEQEMSSARNPKQQTLAVESQSQQGLLSGNEIAINEAIIEEREQGIQEVQQQISEVNEIFKDLAVLVQGQGALIDDFSSNIGNTYFATSQAASQLSKASKLQKSNSSLTCLVLVIFGIILVIVIIVVV